MKFVEVETKYRADNIPLKDFKVFCQDKTPNKHIFASGYDDFYQNNKDKDAFCRHRRGTDLNQLTFKRKTADGNNFVRVEHNLDLNGVSADQIRALCGEFGYEPNMTIFKTCYVYTYEWYTLVYYIVYDDDMKELGRFIEIEMKEDYAWQTEQAAWDELLVLEKLCKPLGISAQSRVKRSLFELYRK